jgi:hypothetical protein
MTTRVAIYARVSTVNHGQDVGMQTRELRQFAEARAWTVAGEYVDDGVSGAKDSRPELNRLMADAHKRRFDVVCVWRFDRFARSVSHLLRALETFKALGIDFVSYSEQMDTSTPAGKMVFTVLGAVAELDARQAARNRGRCEDCQPPRDRRILANDHATTWYQRRHSQASLLQPVQKPLTSRVRKSLILPACSRPFRPVHKQMFLNACRIPGPPVATGRHSLNL